MGRSDVALSVRQASLHVWKVVVHNTAKTLREILPSLFTLLLGCLAGTSYDKRQVIIIFISVSNLVLICSITAFHSLLLTFPSFVTPSRIVSFLTICAGHHQLCITS